MAFAPSPDAAFRPKFDPGKNLDAAGQVGVSPMEGRLHQYRAAPAGALVWLSGVVVLPVPA